MSSDCIDLPECVLTARSPATRITYHGGQYYKLEQFQGAVDYWANQFIGQPFQRYGLYTNDAYPFAVLLFALLHAGKEVWIAGNNRQGTVQQLQQLNCELVGDWGSGLTFDYHLAGVGSNALPLWPLNFTQTQLVIFTSGSTGQPKPIEKTLGQFLVEVETLEKLWGKRLGDAEILSTVSHQHIYGLLFRVLWPLATGRCFHSSIYLNPEILVNNINNIPSCWVASPAHLKRLDPNSPWQEIADLNAIFSSGGALPGQAAQQINATCGQTVIEIYGSSETGGIAWREQELAWTLFPDMKLTPIDGIWQLNSPYLPTNTYYSLDDQITLLKDGRFSLNGRADRIAKIEEKRLSLVEVEKRLVTLSWIDEAYAFVISKKREVVAVAVALNKEGVRYLSVQGRSHLIRQLRKTLEFWFDAVVLPKKWLFVNSIPLTPQGKIDQPLLTNLLAVDKQKFPQALRLEMFADNIQLGIKVPQEQELIYFPDHFTSYPILPGVVQLAWAEYFGKLFFAVDGSLGAFSHLEVVKFIQVIRPGDELTLLLNWKAVSGELCFNFSARSGGCSSGRIVYKHA